MTLEGPLDLSGLRTVDFGGMPMVRIGDWLIARDRIVAIVPEDAKERQSARVG